MRCLPRRNIESEYYEGTWRNRRREHRRCRACFTCPTCTPGTKHRLTDFVHGSKICKTCARTLTCVVCKRAKLKMEYPDSVWSHQNKRGHHRCHACFFCPRCPPEEVHTLCDFELGAAICKRCDTLTCSACQKQVDKTFMPQKSRRIGDGMCVLRGTGMHNGRHNTAQMRRMLPDTWRPTLSSSATKAFQV